MHDDLESSREQDQTHPYRQAIAATRQSFRSHQVKPSWWKRLTESMRPPGWMPTDDALREVYRQQWTLIEKGRVVWGHIVQANKLLFEAGAINSPANVLYSTDAYFDDLAELPELAGTLFSTKGEQLDDPEVQRFADALAAERTRPLRLLLPKRMTGDREVCFSTIMVHREHLPTGMLSTPFFPLLVAPDVVDVTMILPCKFWDPLVIQLWNL